MVSRQRGRVGLTPLFVFCTRAIYQVKPLHQFAEAAISIAQGNTDSPLPVYQRTSDGYSRLVLTKNLNNK